jgi:purine nucleoside permease
VDTIHFALNSDLAAWAFETTKTVPLEDSPAMAAFREAFTAHPAARQAPSVQRGETLASSTYWHGALMNRWANSWVKLYAGEGANFVTTNMEDTGTLTALGRLGALGLADPERVLVLRTVSNYSMPPAGRDAAWSSTAPYPDQGQPALEAAFRVGSKALEGLLAAWPALPWEVDAGAAR